MALWLSVYTHNTAFVSSNLARVAMETPFVRKATGNHLIKKLLITSLNKSLEPCLWFLLCSKSSMLNTIYEESNGKPPHKKTANHFSEKNLEPCLWFLLCSKLSMRRSADTTDFVIRLTLFRPSATVMFGISVT